MDDKRASKSANKKVAATKANPFEQKVKSAFDDLEDDFDFGNDIKKGPMTGSGKGEPQLTDLLNVQQHYKKPAGLKQSEEDNGLFVDNDFGDDFGEDEDEEEEEEEELPVKAVVAEVKQVAHDIFEDSRTKEKKLEVAPNVETGSKQAPVEEEGEEDQEKLIID